jgi:DNA-binding transcriptional regulator GbsR (MarR family)
MAGNQAVAGVEHGPGKGHPRCDGERLQDWHPFRNLDHGIGSDPPPILRVDGMERVEERLRRGRVAARNRLKWHQVEAPATPIQAPQHIGDLLADPAIPVVQNGQRFRRTRYHHVTNMASKLDTVKYQVTTDREAGEVEAIRRRFAAAWGQMGAAWGVTPSTAAVQGYMLVHGGPVTDKELQDALGLSHRAIRLALEDCEEWGIVRRAPEPRRSGRRGPAGRAWLALDDHWEWFRRVIEARKEREGDPVIAILEQCLIEARRAKADEQSKELEARLESLLAFVRQFDHALSAVVRARTEALRKLFSVLASQDAKALDRLLASLADIPEDELGSAVRTIARLPSGSLRRLLRLAGRPTIARLLGGR